MTNNSVKAITLPKLRTTPSLLRMPAWFCPMNHKKQQLGQDTSHETDEFETKDESVELPEDLLVPDEMLDDEDEHVELHEQANASTDYSGLNKEELVKTAEKLLKEKPIESLKPDIDIIKIQFYKKHKTDFEKLRKQFVEEGGVLEDFKPEPDALKKN